MNEEILERAVQGCQTPGPEQRAKAAEILRRLEEETEKMRRKTGGYRRRIHLLSYSSNSNAMDRRII